MTAKLIRSALDKATTAEFLPYLWTFHSADGLEVVTYTTRKGESQLYYSKTRKFLWFTVDVFTCTMDSKNAYKNEAAYNDWLGMLESLDKATARLKDFK